MVTDIAKDEEVPGIDATKIMSSSDENQKCRLSKQCQLSLMLPKEKDN